MDLLLPLLLVALLIPMFLGVRRQKREMAKVTEMQDALKVGDRVVTTSGLFGTVVELDDTSVDLEIAEEVVTTWLRQSIREVRNDDIDATGDTTAEDSAEAVSSNSAEAAASNGTADDHVAAPEAAADASRLTKD
ncbi:preprotein translocase subunit YajC [Nocardia aurantiaca]|uniref:Preprotein translocase subunit YajC n=1 Tax=Nocardia aurantiaca TaxID=2675850 RepID=A0A6I3L332_9NOCA|nr:preprotein translocase subunit YajC [Nocardia aurantiaca]MTE14946.1 preprotein translocase subunit YajC [Nocardia aurantiaca]